MRVYRCTSCGTFLELSTPLSLMARTTECPNCGKPSLVKYVNDQTKLHGEIKALTEAVDRQAGMIAELHHGVEELKYGLEEFRVTFAEVLADVNGEEPPPRQVN